jgi:thiol:disulfide interchange protein DsbC
MKQIVKKRDDIVFYLKMYPILQLHPAAYDKSKTIICEQDNEKAMKLLEEVYAKKTIPSPSCKTDIVDKNIALANKLGVTGTPTLIYFDGSRSSGALEKDALLQMIDTRKMP